MLHDLKGVDLEPTDVHIKGYNGIAEPCVGKAKVDLQMGRYLHDEEIFFSSATKVNVLSRDACRSLGIIQKKFPHERVKMVKATKNWNRGVKH